MPGIHNLQHSGTVPAFLLVDVPVSQKAGKPFTDAHCRSHNAARLLQLRLAVLTCPMTADPLQCVMQVVHSSIGLFQLTT